MHQPFLDSERTEIIVIFRVRQRLIDVEKLHTFGLIVQLYRLQTGDVSDKRRSGQAAEYQDLVVFIRQITNVDQITQVIMDNDIGKLLTDFWCVDLEPFHARR